MWPAVALGLLAECELMRVWDGEGWAVSLGQLTDGHSRDLSVHLLVDKQE